MPKSSSSASRAQPASASRPAHLDLRDPLVVDTRELGRRPGAMRRLQRVVPAPANLSNPVIGVRAGSDIELDLRLAAVVEGVLVSGTAVVAVTGECGRCLEPLHAGLDVDVQELYVYPGHEDPDDELPMMLLVRQPTLGDTEACQWVVDYYRRWGAEDETRGASHLDQRRAVARGPLAARLITGAHA